MATGRELVNIFLFNGQAVYSRRLFEPETKDFAGKPLDKPSYSLNIRYPKTRPNWYEEPALKSFTNACQTVKMRDMADVPFQRIEFPIRDGDLPNQKNKIPDWARGHWYVRASTTYVPKVYQTVDGVQSELPALMLGSQRLWGDGDTVSVALSIGKRLTDAVGIRCYLNSVMFTDHGPELKTSGGDTDWGEAFTQAAAEGITIKTGSGPFNTGAGGGFNPGAGNGPGGFNPGAGGGPSGFNPGGGNGGFNPGGGGGGSFNPGGGFNPGGSKPPF
jgi:hypothetical protein